MLVNRLQYRLICLSPIDQITIYKGAKYFRDISNKKIKKIKPLLKKTIDTITKLVMVLLVIMGLVLVLMETVMDPVGLYW